MDVAPPLVSTLVGETGQLAYRWPQRWVGEVDATPVGLAWCPLQGVVQLVETQWLALDLEITVIRVNRCLLLHKIIHMLVQQSLYFTKFNPIVWTLII